MKKIHERILEINEKQSSAYVNDESARQRHWAKHTTFFACIKCMDGRVHFPNMTLTPIGIVKPFRAIGGKFDVFWPSFLGRMRHWVEAAIHQGSRSCVFVSYHYSGSDPHLGCAGWKYDTAAARAHAEKLRDDLRFVFGEQLTAIVAGIETDCDVLTLHGPGGDVSGASLKGKSEEEMRMEIKKCFPMVTDDVLRDLVPFMKGNASHVSGFDTCARTSAEKDHDERIVAVGQGFDWLVTGNSNLALIINDSDPNLQESVKVAASLIVKNLARAMNDEATLFTNVPYTEPGLDYRQAIARTKSLNAFIKKVVGDAYPELSASGCLHTLATVMFEPSKKIEVVGEE